MQNPRMRSTTSDLVKYCPSVCRSSLGISFSNTLPTLAVAPTVADVDVLARFGIDETEIEALASSGLFGQ